MPYKLVPISKAPAFDSHVHSVPHGAGFMQQYSQQNILQLIDVAAAAGLTTICVTDHMPWPTGTTDPSPEQDCAMNNTLYQTIWKNYTTIIQPYGRERGITVLWGGEYDVFPDKPLANYGTTWKVLGQHCIDEVNGMPWDFDLSAESFAQGVAVFGIKKVVQRYFELLQQAVQAYQFDSVAHLDLITKYNVNNKYFVEDELYQQYVKDTLVVIKQRDTCLEINLGGYVATGHVVPQPWIIQQAVRLNIPITIGSDEHGPEKMNLTIWQDVYKQLEQLGVKQLALPIIK